MLLNDSSVVYNDSSTLSYLASGSENLSMTMLDRPVLRVAWLLLHSSSSGARFLSRLPCVD